MNPIQFLICTIFLAITTPGAMAQPIHTHLATTLLSDAGGPYTPQQYRSIKYADVSGDGIPDLCYLETSGVVCAVAWTDPNNNLNFGIKAVWTMEFNLNNTAPDSMWQTMQFGDLDNDGKADLCIRQSYGLRCMRSDGTKFVNWIDGASFANGFSDSMNFGADPSYWRTIRLVDVHGDGMLEPCGRAQRGIICQKFDGRLFQNYTVWSAQFSDANNWNSDPAYWSTIQFPDINRDGKADVCGRAGVGLICALSNGTTFGAHGWSSEVFSVDNGVFSDANGWKKPEYYSTIQFAVQFQGLNGPEPSLCGRGTAGFYCGIANLQNGSLPPVTFSGITNLVATEFANANGWTVDNKYLDLWLMDVNDGRADICGRGYSGIFCTISQGNTVPGFASGKIWIDNFGDDNYWNTSESYWRTVQPVHFPSIHTYTPICGRGYAGIWCSDYVQ